MSRLAKKPIILPQGVSLDIKGRTVAVKGPKGEIKKDFKDMVNMEISGNSVILTPKGKAKIYRALLGTYASHLINMIEGVTKGFVKKLIIEGVGFRAAVDGGTLVLNLGFSHQVKMPVPDGIEIKVEKSLITVSGRDKEVVGQTSANIRALKKPEPYKGKGIRYENEIIRRKAGKKAATS